MGRGLCTWHWPLILAYCFEVCWDVISLISPQRLRISSEDIVSCLSLQIPDWMQVRSPWALMHGGKRWGADHMSSREGGLSLLHGHLRLWTECGRFELDTRWNQWPEKISSRKKQIQRQKELQVLKRFLGSSAPRLDQLELSGVCCCL